MEPALTCTDTLEGQGAACKAGDTVSVHYTGRLDNGTKFDSSHDRRQPFSFKLGAGQVIAGWDQGGAGLKVGGERAAVIPLFYADNRTALWDYVHDFKQLPTANYRLWETWVSK